MLSQLDLIAFRNPTYFRPASVDELRALTRAGLALADIVCF